MTRDELIQRFGEEMGTKPPLTINNQGQAGNRKMTEPDSETDEMKGPFAKAEVWEIWCKKDRMIRWLTRDPLLEPARISTDRERYGIGGEIAVSGRLRDEAYRPMKEARALLRP